VTDPHLVPRVTASTLRLREQPGRSPFEAIVAFIGPRRVLILLDNCEHLIVACAELIEALLRACPEVRVLAPSREALAVPGEVAWLVPPLTLGTPERHAAESEAAQLFVERARAVCRTFALGERNAPSVFDVCRRLDGIPLAIELAAARTNVLGVDQLAVRLDDALAVLNTGSRLAPARLQTMRAAIAWSVDLLSPAEQCLFRRLSVFAGGFTLEAAEHVGVTLSDDPAVVLDLLSKLVEKSLVITEPVTAENAMRYRLLEPLRQYAQETLRACGEEAATRIPHVDFFLAFAERGSDGMRKAPTQRLWLHRLERDVDNLRTALSWLIDQRDVERAARLLYALRNLWFYGGRAGEGRAWVDRVAALPGLDGLARVRVLLVFGLVSFGQADHATTRRVLEDAFALAREIDEPIKAGTALTMLVLTERIAGNLDRARLLATQQAEIGRTTGDAYVEGMGLYYLGQIANIELDLDHARTLLEQARARFAAIDAPHVGLTVQQLAMISYEQRDYATARALAEEGLVRAQTIRGGWAPASAALPLGWVAIAQCDWTRASEVLTSALANASEIRNMTLVIELLEPLSAVAAGLGQATRALRLDGAALAMRDTLGTHARGSRRPGSSGASVLCKAD
jgi:predicted ATPase